jgi:hypothetical protein
MFRIIQPIAARHTPGIEPSTYERIVEHVDPPRGTKSVASTRALNRVRISVGKEVDTLRITQHCMMFLEQFGTPPNVGRLAHSCVKLHRGRWSVEKA